MENGAAVAVDLIEQVLQAEDGVMAAVPEEPVYVACD
jgi:hypothetical protein